MTQGGYKEKPWTPVIETLAACNYLLGLGGNDLWKAVLANVSGLAKFGGTYSRYQQHSAGGSAGEP